MVLLQGRSTKLALLVAFALVATATASVKDGLPRPVGVDNKPSTSYGNIPAVTYKGAAAPCTWYGFKDLNYADSDTTQCLKDAWSIISDPVASPPSSLQAYGYYWLQSYYDAKYKEYLCYIGCFDLGASSPGSSPSPSTSPTTSPISPPPALMSPPPPASLFQPPPPPTIPPPLTSPPSIAPSIVPSIAPAPMTTVVPTPSPVGGVRVPTPAPVLQGPSSSPLGSPVPTPAKSTVPVPTPAKSKVPVPTPAKSKVPVPAPSTTTTPGSVRSPAVAPAPPVGSGAGSSIRPAGSVLSALVFAAAAVLFVAAAQ